MGERFTGFHEMGDDAYYELHRDLIDPYFTGEKAEELKGKVIQVLDWLPPVTGKKEEKALFSEVKALMEGGDIPKSAPWYKELDEKIYYYFTSKKSGE